MHNNFEKFINYVKVDWTKYHTGDVNLFFKISYCSYLTSQRLWILVMSSL